MIITSSEILKELASGRIKIEPFDEKAVGPASVDLTLDNQLRIFTSKEKIIEEDIDYKKITTLITVEDYYLLQPNELILGITKEKITLPEDICGFLNSRSRYARIGLMSHITAPFVSPGVSNKQVLEIFNAGHNAIKLFPGTKICQIAFAQCIGKAKYAGEFRDQEL
jgi:dCTP deaminase